MMTLSLGDASLVLVCVLIAFGCYMLALWFFFDALMLSSEWKEQNKGRRFRHLYTKSYVKRRILVFSVMIAFFLLAGTRIGMVGATIHAHALYPLTGG